MKKKHFVITTIVSVILMACQKDPFCITPAEEGTHTVTIVPQTEKTVIDIQGKTTSVKWTGTETVTAFENDNASKNARVSTTDGGATAVIEAEFKNVAADSYTYSAVVAKSLSAAKNPLLPFRQTATAASYDSDADILISDFSEPSPTVATILPLRFARPVVINRMMLAGLSADEKVREVEFRASCCLAGRFSIDYAGGKVNEYGISEQKSSIIVSYRNDEAAASDGTFPVYFLSFPTPGGKGCGNFAVKVATDKYIYTKTVSGKTLEFKLNTITKFTMDLSTASKETVSGDETYVQALSIDEIRSGARCIIAAAAEYDFAMGTWDGSVNHDAQSVVKEDAGGKKSITVNNASEVPVFVIERQGEYGGVDYYSFRNVSSGQYYGYYLQNKNGGNSLTEDRQLTDAELWKISISENGETTITNKRYSGFRIQYYSQAGLFSTYNTNQKPVAIHISNRLPAPQISVNQNKNAGTVTVIWDRIPDAVGYKVWKDDSSEDCGVDATFHTFSGLTEGSTYSFKVEALAPDGKRNSVSAVRTLKFGSNDLKPTGWLELPEASDEENLISLTHYITVGRRNYTFLYDPAMLASSWVAYPLAAGDFMTGVREDSFGFDPDVPVDKQTNVKSGYGVYYSEGNPYARGHQIPNADRNADADAMAQTYYSTNMTPQIQNGFNSGIWSSLEATVRDETAFTDTVYVVTGATFHKTGGHDDIKIITNTNDHKPLPVPNYYWKVLLKVKRDGEDITAAQAIGFWLEHKPYSGEDPLSFTTSVDRIEQWTGLDFFTNLPGIWEDAAEQNLDWNAFHSF